MLISEKKQNQNQNTGKNGPDQNIRPPFQENYAESSDPGDPEQDTQINLMGLDDQNPVFLSKDEEEFHMLQQLKTPSGESFDYKQGYDSAIFEVHKQYNLRSKKSAGPPDQTKKTMSNQPKITNKVPISEVLQILPRPNQNPPSPIIEEITTNQPSVEQPSTSVPLKEP